MEGKQMNPHLKRLLQASGAQFEHGMVQVAEDELDKVMVQVVKTAMVSTTLLIRDEVTKVADQLMKDGVEPHGR